MSLGAKVVVGDSVQNLHPTLLHIENILLLLIREHIGCRFLNWHVLTSIATHSTCIIHLENNTLDLVLDSNSDNILDAALKSGADLPFACKGGVCCTCKAKIIEGTARMEVNYALEQDEIDAGYILTCQAHPTSEKLIVSFDE